MKNSRMYIKQAHEKLVRERNSRELKINNPSANPYDDTALDSARDHLYLIIPTNPSNRLKNKNLRANQNNELPTYLNPDMSIHENSSIDSGKYRIRSKKSLLDEKASKLTHVTIPVTKPRERSRRLYDRRDDIYLPSISKNDPSIRGKSMFNLHNKKKLNKDISPIKHKVVKNLKASQSKETIQYQSPQRRDNYDMKMRTHANTSLKKPNKYLGQSNNHYRS